MYNFNGQFYSDMANPFGNRGFLFGDALFETVRVRDGKVLFLEDHYFRLMSGMRIVRMSIPMSFTMEFIEQQILETAGGNQHEASGRVRLSVFRDGAGLYAPETNAVSYVITSSALENSDYIMAAENCEVELYKDFHLSKHLLSSVKTTNKMLHVTASIYARENGYDNCLLINEDKNVTEAINGNIFMVNGDTIVTPPVSDGCIGGILRKQLVALIKKSGKWTINEASISPFDLQKADELFITNVISGIRPITKYRKKEFTTQVAESLILELNNQITAD